MGRNKKKKYPVLKEDEKAIQYKNEGKFKYVALGPGIHVYDRKGKRRIGKDGIVQIQLMERVVYSTGKEYIVKEFGEKYVILKEI